MADEFDPDAYLNAPLAFDPDAYLNKPPTTQPAAPEPTGPGQLESLGRGALQGVTANFSDEARGAHAAGGTDWFGEAVGYGSPVMGPLLRGVYGAGKYFMGDERAKKAYDEAVEKDRRANEEAKKANPLTYGAGELAGAVGSMALAPAAAPLKGAGLARRTWEAGKTGAKIGGLYGGAAGAGEGVGTDKALKAGEGLLTGTLGGLAGGAAGEVLGTGAKAAWGKFGAPIASAVRGWRDPTGEGYKRAAGAVNSGADQIAAGSAKGMTGAEWLAAKNRGEPVMIVDLGGEPARAMLRSASNTSPEARGVIDNAVQDRFRTQVDRAGNFIRGMISGNANIWNKAEKLRADYDKWRTPLYEAAYKAGERPLYSETLERLAGAPAVADAMKGAVETGKNHAIKEGFGAFNPPVTIDSTGKLVFNKGPTGAPTYPDLRFWDYTYRRLRDEGQKLKQSGAGEEGNAVSGLAGQLRDELDKLVPQFGTARGEAAKWFKAEDVMEAGQKAVNFKGSPQELKALVDKIKNPRERELFEESYVSNLALKAENAPDNADLTKRLFNSKAERQRFEAVLGPSRAKAMQGFIDRERIYDWARTAVQGNSSTVRQMIESGLAGGAAGMYYGDGDVATSIGAGAGALAGLGVRGAGFKHSVSGLVTSGAQKALGYVDRKTAEKAAEFLTSDDPQVLMKGLAMVRQKPRLAEGLNAIANRLWSLQGAQAARPNVAPLQLPAPVRAEEEEKPRRAEGGAVPFDEEEEPYDITGEEATLGTPLALQAPHPLSDEALAIAQINQAEAERRARSPSFEERYEGLRAKPGAHHAKGAGAVADWLQGRDSFKDRWEGKKAPVEEKPGHWARALGRGVDRAFGLNGQERYETWPEKMLVSGAKLPGDVYSGKEPIVEMNPETGEYRTAQKVIERAQDTSGLAGSGGIGAAEAGAVGIFGGKLAKTANLEKLKIAELMEQHQRPPHAIWEETGWFKGADGEWRFEIPDAGATFKHPETVADVAHDYLGWLEQNALPRVDVQRLLETAPPEMVAPLEGFVSRWKAAQEDAQWTKNASDYLTHKELYEAYPELANLPTSIRETGPNIGGYYAGPEAGITLKKGRNADDTRSVMLHELQHAVQEREGFTRGTNPDYEVGLLAREARRLEDTMDMTDAAMRALRQEKGIEAYTSPEYRALEKQFVDASQRLKQLQEMHWASEGQKAYRRNAGEVEARNVQTRRDYSPVERETVPTWTEDVARFLQRTPRRGALQASTASPAVVRGPVKSDPGYAYHATNAENLFDIASNGLKTHKPHEFTDQQAWPDGTTEKRNYFTPTAENTWQFAPENGEPALVRLRQDTHGLRIERGTGELVSTKNVAPEKLEFLSDSGEWLPVTVLRSDSSQPGAAVGALAHSGKGGQLYSAVQRAIENAPQKKMHASQWEGWLKNQPGVKKEEIDWSFSKDLDGVVTKEDLLAKVREKTPELEVVTRKGANADEDAVAELSDQILQQWKEPSKITLTTKPQADDSFNIVDNFGNVVQKEFSRKSAAEQRALLEAQIREGDQDVLFELSAQAADWTLRNSPSTRYADYQLPGAEQSYREILTTLPSKDRQPTQTELDEAAQAFFNQRFHELPEFAQREVENIAWSNLNPRQLRSKDYYSSHWDEPNVLAHVRMNDREIPGVGKSLHLEEVQSDWHQQGRKHGYKNQKLEDELAAIRAKLDNDDILRDKALTDSLRARRDEIKSQLGSGRIPDAPFKSTWADLSLKQAVLRAVDEGYDSISWTPGKQQAERYDLSKHVDQIKYLKNDDGTYNIVPFKNNSPMHAIEHEAVSADKLVDIVGKEVAEKIIKDQGKREGKDIGVLEGIDLSVGGEGMMKFYDKMLVDKANNLFKKWGAKVEYKDLPGALEPTVGNRQRYGGAGATIDTAPDGTMTVRNAETGEAYGTFGPDQYEQASALAEKMHAPRLKVPVLKITPKLREEVQKHGLALFADSSKPGTALNAIEIDDERVPRPPKEKQHKAYASGGRVSATEIDHAPTEAQQEAGNYKKAHTRIQGFDVTVENAKGSQRSGVGPSGQRWTVTMPCAYGYIKGTEGADGDHVDCYIGPHVHSRKVFVVDQKNAETGAFDEHKCFLGFGSKEQARQTYLKGFSDGKGAKRLGAITELPLAAFKAWVVSPASRRPLVQRYASGGAVREHKLSHKAAGYVEVSTKRDGARCETCSMFIHHASSPPSCTLVASPIDAEGWCRHYKRNT